MDESWGAGQTYTDIHDFTGGSDGAIPSGSLVTDGSGNLYDSTMYRGDLSVCHTNYGQGCGVVFEITP
jgi:hypothetical protein